MENNPKKQINCAICGKTLDDRDELDPSGKLHRYCYETETNSGYDNDYRNGDLYDRDNGEI